MNKILVLCYPSHATHIYQGLDVVVFSVLKRYIREERDKHEQTTGEKFSKSNFLQIYGRAHIRAMIPEIIETAFQKTGVWPYNADFVTLEMMAPSKETSCKSYIPVAPPTPIHVLANLMHKVAISNPIAKGVEGAEDAHDGDSVGEDFGSKIATLYLEEGEEFSDEDEGRDGDGDGDKGGEIRGDKETEGNSEDADDKSRSNSPDIDAIIIKEAILKLRESDLGFLVGGSNTYPLRSTASVILPLPTYDAMTIQPKTANERLLLAALRESEAQATYYRQRTLTLQAANIINEAYCKFLRQQLAFKEAKKAKGKGKGKLKGDGLPVLLTGDVFFEKVVSYKAAQRREAWEKEDC